MVQAALEQTNNPKLAFQLVEASDLFPFKIIKDLTWKWFSEFEKLIFKNNVLFEQDFW